MPRRDYAAVTRHADVISLLHASASAIFCANELPMMLPFYRAAFATYLPLRHFASAALFVYAMRYASDERLR